MVLIVNIKNIWNFIELGDFLWFKENVWEILETLDFILKDLFIYIKIVGSS